MEINLKNHFEVLEVLFDAMPFVFWKDRRGVYLGGNLNQAKAFGFKSPAEFIGKNIFEILDDQNAAKSISENDNEIMNNGNYRSIEETIGEKTYLSQKHAIKDSKSNVIGLIGFAMDVTELKVHEKLVKHQQEELNKSNIIITEQEKFKKVVGQMMHDMTSPIASINTIVSKLGGNIPENDRVTLRSATGRMEGISGRLLSQYENKDVNELEEPLVVSLALLQIMNEKKEEYLESGVNFVVNIEADARFCFIQHNSDIFKRMISNLVNNAVDALKSVDSKKKTEDNSASDTANNSGANSSDTNSSNKTHEKEVAVSLSISPKSAVVSVKDNGPGMPQHIQDLFSEGQSVSEGKGDAGHGIGLTQIHDAIAFGKGRSEIYANKNGTEIIMFFPLAPAPHWIATGIKLNATDTVIILDDDTSIHGAWDNKFADIPPDIAILFERTYLYQSPESADGTTLDSVTASLNDTNIGNEVDQTLNPTLRIKHFTYGKDVIKYLNTLTPEQKHNTFLLTDYELIDQGINGLDVVEETNMLRAILVTSYATKPMIKERVTKLGIRTLPKELVSRVEIEVDKKLAKGSKIVDMVWVEDQDWYIDSLVNKHYSYLKIDRYNDPVSFMESVMQYPLDTRIILDTFYDHADGVNIYKQTGYDLAAILHDLGYTKLILLAGEDPKGRAPKYLQVVRKKDDATDTLDKI